MRVAAPRSQANAIGLAFACLPWREMPEVWRELAGHPELPVTVLCGQRDSFCPPGPTLEWIDATLGEAAHVSVLAEYGHSLPCEFPLECSELVLQHLGTRGGAMPLPNGCKLKPETSGSFDIGN